MSDLAMNNISIVGENCVCCREMMEFLQFLFTNELFITKIAGRRET